MYDIEIDRTTGCVRIRARGFWDEQTLQDFARDHIAAVRRMGMPNGAHTILGDLRSFTIQPIDLIARAQSFFMEVPNKARRVAIVTSGGLAALQARRMAAVRDDMRLFHDMAEAETWVAERGGDRTMGNGKAE